MAERSRRARVAARRAAGQHFLRSSRLAASIVDAAGVAPGDVVVDVGAGAGILAAELARRGARVLAVELDPVLAAGLRRRFGRAANVTVIEADAVGQAWPREPFRVVANLPFAVGTAILRSLLDDPRTPLRSADVIVEWDLARKRAAVWPSTLASAYWGAWYELRLARRLPPSVFAPQPRVDAALLRIARRAEPLVREREHVSYGAFLRAGFGGRSLRELVPPLGLKRLALELGFAPDAQARDLDAAQWAVLYATARAVRRVR